MGFDPTKLVHCYASWLQVEREARSAVLEVERAENMVEHGKEIFSRPARQWIVSEHRKVGAVYISSSHPSLMRFQRNRPEHSFLFISSTRVGRYSRRSPRMSFE